MTISPKIRTGTQSVGALRGALAGCECPIAGTVGHNPLCCLGLPPHAAGAVFGGFELLVGCSL